MERERNASHKEVPAFSGTGEVSSPFKLKTRGEGCRSESIIVAEQNNESAHDLFNYSEVPISFIRSFSIVHAARIKPFFLLSCLWPQLPDLPSWLS